METHYSSLVEKAMAHDESAFWKIYEMKWRDALYTATKYLGNGTDAADATQEAFLRAYNNIGSLRHPQAFDSWLYRILINACNDLVKARKKEIILDESAWSSRIAEEDREDHHPASLLERKESDATVLEAINGLPERQRIVVVLHYYNEMPYREIAATLGLTESGVESRLRRARKAIKGYLGRAENDMPIPSSALAAAPIFAAVLKTDANLIISPHMGETIRTGIQGAIALAAAGGSAVAAGGAGSTGAAVSAGTASTAATAAPTAAAAGAGAKIAAVAVALTLATGAGVAYTVNSRKAEPTPTPLATAPKKELSAVVEETATPAKDEPVKKASPSKTPKAQPKATEKPVPATPTPKKTEKKASSPKSDTTKPAGITTLADMIGAGNAQRLVSLSGSAQKSDAQSFLRSIGMKSTAQQKVDDDTFRLYIFEREDKRLRVIEKDGSDDYGISYRLESRSTALPETWELALEY